MDRAASEYYLWSLEGKPVSVHLSLDVVHELQPLVRNAAGVRPFEHGGVLLGRLRQVNDCYIVSVDAAERTECEHARGASWTLSARDKQELLRRIRRQHGSRSVVGWFRTHTRSGLYLDQNDFSLFTEFFAHPSCVSLVIRPEDREATFFFWEKGDVQRSAPYQTFPFIPQALGTRHEVARVEPPVELVAVPAAVTAQKAVAAVPVWRQRAIYAIPVAAGLIAGLLWQPSVERSRSVEIGREARPRAPERTVFAPPESMVETPVETSVVSPSEPSTVAEDAPVVRRSRSKPIRKLNVSVPRRRTSSTPEPTIDVQPPAVAAAERLDNMPVPAALDLPKLQETAREDKPSKMRRVIGSIPLLGFLKKKKQPKTEQDTVVRRQVQGSVASTLTAPEAGLSSPRPVRPEGSTARPRTAAPAAR